MQFCSRIALCFPLTWACGSTAVPHCKQFTWAQSINGTQFKNSSFPKLPCQFVFLPCVGHLWLLLPCVNPLERRSLCRLSSSAKACFIIIHSRPTPHPSTKLVDWMLPVFNKSFELFMHLLLDPANTNHFTMSSYKALQSVCVCAVQVFLTLSWHGMAWLCCGDSPTLWGQKAS